MSFFGVPSAPEVGVPGVGKRRLAISKTKLGTTLPAEVTQRRPVKSNKR